MKKHAFHLLIVVAAFVFVMTGEAAEKPAVKTGYYAVGFAKDVPRFSYFSVDSFGRGTVAMNPVLATASASARFRLEQTAPALFRYAAAPSGNEAWTISCSNKQLLLQSTYTPNFTNPPFELTFNQKSNHATVLGRITPDDRAVEFPCVLHLPDMGTIRIGCNVKEVKLEYDARRWKVPFPFVRIQFPAATAAHRSIEYTLEVVLIHPQIAGMDQTPLYDGFRRGYLNLFQVNPRTAMLANNSSSDPVAFTTYEYAEMARHLPPLADGLTAMDLVRMTLDRYLAGAKGYGQAGYACTPMDADLIPWKTPWTSLDTYPSLLISACICAEANGGTAWARQNYDKLLAWAREMIANDKDGDGLLEYPGTGNLGDRPQRDRRPANWWDTINFGHEDAYANALAYHACGRFAELARKLGRTEDATWITSKAGKLRAAYAPALLNPATGLLAGWRSADGQLHDYAFPFVQGAAITYGLIDTPLANRIMDRLLAKFSQVGYTNFSLGLPGNLLPIRKGDYVQHGPAGSLDVGEPKLDDGSDAFQIYENGGSTACFAYFTVKALYQLGRRDDARRIFVPMLQGFSEGNFQGFCENGKSKDWRDWKGGCHGYEGLLVDNYFALLAVFDDLSRQPLPETRNATGQ